MSTTTIIVTVGLYLLAVVLTLRIRLPEEAAPRDRTRLGVLAEARHGLGVLVRHRTLGAEPSS